MKRRKATKRLEARQAAYDDMKLSADQKGAYTRPGSNSK